ncbi:DUF5681 domain-containing protein [Noviherbaspirillum humi]|uniref:DUF5681 domain-containing protein n=1 Tax=Noviherbaspirillum humi TaxID=1688639 RepID=UPI003CCBFD4E
MTDIKKRRGRWEKGTSGNPAGRQPGSGKIQRLRDALGNGVDDVIHVVLQAARDGDLTACRLVLERCIPPLRPMEQPAPFPLPDAGTLTESGQAVLQSVAEGQITPAQANHLLNAIASLARVVEFDELERRLAALEVNREAS